MTKIGLISDTHDYLDDEIFHHFKDCDEIWHAGDFGSTALIEKLKTIFCNSEKKVLFRGVYGNIDSHDIRHEFPERMVFNCEQVKVMMQHIGGYPGRYAPGVKVELKNQQVKLFISGHSHILKIMYDDAIQCLHINPGAAGKHGWHKVRTIVSFVIHENDIRDCEVIELGGR